MWDDMLIEGTSAEAELSTDMLAVGRAAVLLEDAVSIGEAALPVEVTV